MPKRKAAQKFRRYESRLVKSADGTEIFADAVGNRASGLPTIVMIPGFAMVKAAFDPIFEDTRWTSKAFLVRYDTRGQGKSGKPSDDEAWVSERLSEDFEAVCKEFNVTNTFVMGWSLGAAHFVDIVNHHRSIVINGLINAAGLPYLDITVLSRILNPEALTIFAGLSQSTDSEAFKTSGLQLLSWLSDSLTPALSQTLLDGMTLVPKDLAVRLTRRVQDPTKMLRLGREGKLNLFIILGGRDKFFVADEVKKVFGELDWINMEFKTIEGADHMSWIPRPDEFRDSILKWVQRCK